MEFVLVAFTAVLLVLCAEQFRGGFLADDDEIAAAVAGEDDRGWGCWVWFLAAAGAAVAVAAWAAAAALMGGA